MKKNSDDDKVSNYWMFDTNTTQIRSAIDGYCLSVQSNIWSQSGTNYLILMKCASLAIPPTVSVSSSSSSTSKSTLSASSLTGPANFTVSNQAWDIGGTQDYSASNLKLKSTALCMEVAASHYTSRIPTSGYENELHPICNASQARIYNVKARANLKEYNLIQKYAQESVTANKNTLRDANGNISLPYSQITNFDGKYVLGVVAPNALNVLADSIDGKDGQEVRFVTPTPVAAKVSSSSSSSINSSNTSSSSTSSTSSSSSSTQSSQGQFWYYEPNSRMIYSDFYNKCLAIKTAGNSNISALTGATGMILQTCNTTDNRQKWLFYQPTKTITPTVSSAVASSSSPSSSQSSSVQTQLPPAPTTVPINPGYYSLYNFGAVKTVPLGSPLSTFGFSNTASNGNNTNNKSSSSYSSSTNNSTSNNSPSSSTQLTDEELSNKYNCIEPVCNKTKSCFYFSNGLYNGFNNSSIQYS